MQKFVCLLLISLSLVSCSNNHPPTTETNANAKDGLKQKFMPALNGAWVLTDYIHALEQTKSPLKSADQLKGVVGMVINATTASDSVVAPASWNNHEGYEFTIYFSAGQNPGCLKTNITDIEDKTNYFEIGLETTENQPSLVLYHYNKSHQLLDKKGFTKVVDKQADNDPAWGIQHVANEKLFAGSYALVDNKKASTNVTFTNDGTIAGHPVFKTYTVLTDFLGGPESVLDGITFNMGEENSTWLSFKIEADAIYLYNIIGDVENYEPLTLGKVQYKLVRQ
ncbi:MAG: hypothetical protein JNJ57_10975 [Saprospiraceae bacterium]|nr:hypothetical protein [Saprospiraceae bacterium]